jgi:hypothetical protein
VPLRRAAARLRAVNDTGMPLGLDDRERLAVTVGGSGLGVFLLGIVLRSRLLRLLGLGAALTGGALYAREKLAERGTRIDEAETAVRSALDDLDPVARAQVLMDVARSKD